MAPPFQSQQAKSNTSSLRRSAYAGRRQTLPSSGLAPAAQAWPSFHSGPSPRRLREPLMSNVRHHTDAPVFSPHQHSPMRLLIPFVYAAILSSCASSIMEHAGEQSLLGRVQERKIIGSFTDRANQRSNLPIRERALSTQPFPEPVLRPVYEYLVVFEDGRTTKVQSTNAGPAIGDCVRVIETTLLVPLRLSSESGCK